ncbi:hypothetical protein CAPTEDRAFT_128788 [Capitella teleta]|uniref:PDZ domain-containing protein n=1 Tax=Capitella teleta TaxID=283909 RepID=R7VFF4_CAPTE|nr:hypothetical protein CAPTEDRAFT_128788 [Capitella teleta]|eukprot:ELU17578.1 hypothetical protein CAPTEDRAFT_128788 [Capitella teleta]
MSYCCPLQCNPKGRAAAAGLGVGDTILSICGTNITQMTSMQIKQELLRAGNDLDLIIRNTCTKTCTTIFHCNTYFPRNGMQAFGGVAPGGPAAQRDEPRVQVVEESIPSLGGPKFKDVKPKTYQVLENELPASEQGGEARGTCQDHVM